MNDQKIRTVCLYKDYFTDFYDKQKQKVKDKIIWTFRLIERRPKRHQSLKLKKQLK